MKCLTCGTEMKCVSDGNGIDFESCELCASKSNIHHNNDGSIGKAEWFKSNLHKYTLGLLCGGLMEDPEWHIEMVKTLYAEDLKDAKNKWAKLTGEDQKETWNAERQTVWGWSIMVLNSTDNRIEEKDYFRG